MFHKKPETKLSEKALEKAHENLGLWQSFAKRAMDFLAEHRVDLRTLPGFDLTHPLDQASRAPQEPSEQKTTLERLRMAFESARSEETKYLHEYILGLRGLLWSSLNQIQEQRGSAYQEGLRMDHLRDKMVKALDSDDLLQLKVAVKDWIVLHNHITTERKKQFDESQTHFQRQLSRLQNELYQMQTELKLDGLTQVYNRKAFDNEVAKILQLSQLSGRPSTLMIFDIDHFKNVNDTYGHPIGDKVLQSFAKLLVQNFPTRTDFVARYGGEEFVVLMHECDVPEATAKADRFVNILRRTVMSFGQVSLRVTVSIGVAGSKPHERVEDWIKRCDELLYRAKHEGRDCYKIDDNAA